MFLSIIPELGVWGMPDCADCTDGKHPLIMETKTTWRLPKKAWDNDRVQVGIYMLGLETLGFNCIYGLLRYKLSDEPEEVRDFRVALDNELRQVVKHTVHSMRKVLDGSAEPAGADTPGKCSYCKTKHPLIYGLCRKKAI
jgi:CRISPR/Cas system-associated exonuclease Cas4 (RecB family)